MTMPGGPGSRQHTQHLGLLPGLSRPHRGAAERRPGGESSAQGHRARRRPQLWANMMPVRPIL